jgi:hypothetical protein
MAHRRIPLTVRPRCPKGEGAMELDIKALFVVDVAVLLMTAAVSATGSPLGRATWRTRPAR